MSQSVGWGDLPYGPELDRYRQRAAVRRAAYDERLDASPVKQV